MIDLIVDVIKQIWDFTLIVSPWLILGFLFSGLIHAFIGERFIRQHLGGGRFSSVWKATVFGIPLPICSCGVIPLAAGLKNDGASKAATMSFLVSTPTTGIDSIFVTYAFLGTAFAIVRPLSALVGGLLVGSLVSLLVRERVEKRDFQSNPEHVHSLKDKLKDGFSYGFGALPEDVGKTIFWGILIGGVLSALLPQDLSEVYLSNPVIAYPLMLAISVPLYVCAIASVPVAAAMMAKGLVPGAALAFLIAGTATNAVTIAFVAKKFGKRVLLIYLVSIIFLALVSGILLDSLLGGVVVKDILFKGREIPYSLKLISTLLFVGLVIKSFLKTKEEKMQKAKYAFHVPDMNCKHCQSAVEKALKEIPGVQNFEVLLEEKLVKVDGDVDEATITKQLKKAGYTAKERAQ
ncbi:MAG: permease [candidate division Zixibacteria bacterium]|nr:permease [candidate division Zixibacteria bacterium]